MSIDREIYNNLPEKFNVSEYLIKECNLNKGRKDKAAFYCKDKKYTYGDIEGYACQYGNMLLDLGVEMEQKVAILIPDTEEYIFIFLGAIRAGIIPVLVNEKLKIDQIRYIIDNCRAKVLITNKSWKDKLGNIENPWLKKILLIDKDTELPESLYGIIDNYSKELKTAETCKDDIAYIMYTSGSSGKPKGVLHLHHDMQVAIELYNNGVVHATNEDMIYSVAKLPFAYGLGITLFLTFYCGATSIVDNGTNAFQIIELINKYKPTLFYATPSVYQPLLQVKDMAPINTESIRLMMCAGETLPKALWEQWKENYDYELIEGIGTTEFAFDFISSTEGHIKPGSTGRVIPGFEAKIVDDEGNEVPRGVVGDLVIGGESLMLGYWNRHEETQNVMRGNYMKTGDKFYEDEDGFFWYVGRCIDLFKVNGLWVSASDVEDELLTHPKIAQVAVNDEFDDFSLTKVVAYVVLQDNVVESEELTRELKQFMKSKIDHYKCPSVYRYIKEMPLGATGKIDRLKIKEIAETYKQDK